MCLGAGNIPVNQTAKARDYGGYMLGAEAEN